MLRADTRGQGLRTPPVLYAVIFATVVLRVGFTVVQEVTNVEPKPERWCQGLWNCGYPSAPELALTVGLLVVVVAVIAIGIRGGFPRT